MRRSVGKQKFDRARQPVVPGWLGSAYQTCHNEKSGTQSTFGECRDGQPKVVAITVIKRDGSERAPGDAAVAPSIYGLAERQDFKTFGQQTAMGLEGVGCDDQARIEVALPPIRRQHAVVRQYGQAVALKSFGQGQHPNAVAALDRKCAEQAGPQPVDSGMRAADESR